MSKIYVICGPSGAGKGAIVNRLLEKFPNLVIPPSYTTRPPRVREGTHKKYRFVSRAEFEKIKAEGGMLESVAEHSHLYGTDKQAVEKALKENKTLILELEPRGAEFIKKGFGQDCVIIYINPGSLKTIKQRLLNDPKRANMTHEELAIRLTSAQREMKYQKQADYVVENLDGKLEEAIGEIEQIILQPN